MTRSFGSSADASVLDAKSKDDVSSADGSAYSGQASEIGGWVPSNPRDPATAGFGNNFEASNTSSLYLQLDFEGLRYVTGVRYIADERCPFQSFSPGCLGTHRLKCQLNPFPRCSVI